MPGQLPPLASPIYVFCARCQWPSSHTVAGRNTASPCAMRTVTLAGSSWKDVRASVGTSVRPTVDAVRKRCGRAADCCLVVVRLKACCLDAVRPPTADGVTCFDGFSGVVEHVAPPEGQALPGNVAVGDEVWGWFPAAWSRDTAAPPNAVGEAVVVPSACVAQKPTNLLFAEAAAAVVPVLVAQQAVGRPRLPQALKQAAAASPTSGYLASTRHAQPVVLVAGHVDATTHMVVQLVRCGT